MTRLGLLCIMWGLAVTAQGIPDPTYIPTETVSTNHAHAAASSNATAHYVIIPKRKGVLTILSNDPVYLRSKTFKKTKPDSVTCLKYEEYDEDGKLLNSVFMYNLQQVANFFKEYLDTTICNQQCNK